MWVSAASLAQGFVAAAARFPSREAVRFRDASLTYEALDQASDRIARALRSVGAGPERLVGVCLPRGLDLVATLVGVLKTGSAYLPLDPAYPAERLRFIAGDARPIALVGAADAAARLDLDLVRIDPGALSDRGGADQTPVAVHPDALAYVMYTSGSTGRPKGVAVSHRNVLRLFEAASAHVTFGPRLTWTLFHPYGFDVSVWEMWGALLFGGRLVVVDEETRQDPDAFLRLLRSEKVNVLSQTPSAFYPLLEACPGPPPPDLSEVVFAGEALDFRRLRAWRSAPAPAPRLINMLGPTETTVHATFHELSRADFDTEDVSNIGRPLGDMRLYLLGPGLEPVGEGDVGEIWLAGAGVTRGYHGRPDLTAERYLPCPFGPSGSRMYRTGDLGRRLADGTVAFEGRADDQLKIRGFRIETGEVAAALMAQRGVVQAAVVPWTVGDDRRLAAYVVVDDAGPDAAGLRAALEASLPDYMIPASFVRLDRLPLTANGKLDRAALPPPVVVGGAPYRAPRTAEERLVCELMAPLVGTPRVGLDDDFLALGGHSLMAMRLTSALLERSGKRLQARAVFQARTPAALAARLREAPPLVAPESGRSTSPRAGPRLSWFQEAVWAENTVSGGSCGYNLPWAWRILGPIDEPALAEAIRRVVERHEPLRTAAVLSHGRFRPRTLAPPPASALFTVDDLQALPRDVRGDAALDRLSVLAARTFDLSGDVLMRAALWRLGPDERLLGLVVHHGAVDGASQALVAQEISEIYAAALAGRDAVLPEITDSFGQIEGARQDRLVASGDLDRQIRSWRERLSGGPTGLRLPFDSPHDADRARTLAQRPFTISAGLLARLEDVAREHGASVFAALAAAWGLTLGRLSGQAEVVVTAAVSRREGSGGEHLIGPMINTTLLRLKTGGDISRRAALLAARDAVFAALADSDVPLERALGALGVERRSGWRAGLEAMIAWQTFEPPALVLPGAEAVLLPTCPPQAIADITLMLSPAPDGAACGAIDYDSSLFDAATIERWALQLGMQLEALADRDALDRPVATGRTLSNPEREAALASAKAAGPAAGEATLVDLFAARAAERPEALALVAPDACLTYRALEAAASRLARQLIEAGAGPETIVGVCLDRGADLVIALLGVLISGAAYAPLDPLNPAGRLAQIVRRTRPLVIVTTRALAGLLPQDASLLTLDAPASRSEIDGRSGEPVGPSERRAPLRADNLAYVLFTSGSTGEPKGAAIPHRAVSRLFEAFAPLDRFGPDDVWSLFHAYGFDFSVFEMWGALAHGGRLVLVDEAARRDPWALVELIDREKVSVLCQTPSAFWTLSQVLKPQALPNLRTLVLGGEALDFDRLDAWRHGAGAGLPRVIDIYGPTETTVTATACRVEDVRGMEGGGACIGRPLSDVRVMVLDGGLEPVPLGAPGEIWIAGPGLARGYFDAPGMTAARFLPCPHGPPGSRMYRTGDLGRLLADGSLLFEGRIDGQVKLRGFRIELGEIEAALRAARGVSDAAAMLTGKGESAVLAAAVVASGPLDVGALRAELRGRLPGYMIPSRIIALDRLPTTAHGKVDRRALSARLGAPVAPAARDPASATEATLSRLFAAALDTSQVPLDESFFHLGGHSLRGLRLLWEIEKALGARITLGDLLAHPTVESLARWLDQGGAGAGATSVVRLATQASGWPVFLVHWIEHDLARRLGERRPVFGLAFGLAAPDARPYPGSIEALAGHYVEEMRRTQPVGPYRLIGHSLGGAVAFEMARQLTGAGDSVAFLGLLDSYAPGALDGRRLLPLPRQLANLRRAGARRIVLAAYGRLLAMAVGTPILRERLGRRTADGDVVQRLSLRLLANYRAQPWSGQADLFVASAPETWRREAATSPEIGWRALVDGELRTHPLTGDHMQIVKEPGVGATVAAIEAAMSRLDPSAAAVGVHRPTQAQRTHVGPVRLDVGETVGA